MCNCRCNRARESRMTEIGARAGPFSGHSTAWSRVRDAPDVRAL
ncbi:hypothetical protein BURPS1106B_A3772 [Burkholderia pseudomallei 1106b]|nr:hypothetical protein BURPS1106B_A3772 [Burkholderia pseudomallei 1106b]